MNKFVLINTLGVLLLFLLFISLPLNTDASQHDSALVGRVENLLPNGAFLRDYTRIPETDKELVLYILDYDIAKRDPPDSYYTCPGRVNGQPIEGEYHLALVENDRMVNTVTLPTEGRVGDITSKLRIVYRQLNKIIHKRFNGPKPENKKEALEMSEVHLLELEDLTGDGKPYEFQIEVYAAGCGHVEVLTAGYSPSQNEAIVFPIIGKNPTDPYYWHDNFFPDENGTVNWEYKCGDHANTIYSREKFEFNQTIEAFIMTEYVRMPCKKKYNQDN